MTVFARYWLTRSVIFSRNRVLHLNGSSQRLSSNVKANFSKVGFIGLGNMGGPMAQNMLAKGHNLVVYDAHQEATEQLKRNGASVSSSPQDVASQVDCVITMLPNNASVLEVYQGEKGILKTVKKGTLLIDSSTVDPSVSKTVATTAETRGAMLLDAPVSGGVNAAKSGQLTFMVGGPAEMFSKAQELLSGMGTRIVHCGPVGAGQTSKICNNMLLAISMVGTAEAMNLGIRLGLDPKILMNIFNSSTGRCWSSEIYCPVPGTLENVPSANDYKGGFGTKLMAKDLGLAQDAASRTSTPTPLGSLAHDLYCRMMKSGFADKDFSSIYKFLQEQERN